MAKDYVSSSVAKMKLTNAAGKSRTVELLWGDQVRVIRAQGDQVEVKARGRSGLVPKQDLGGQALLEVYFIDVGQGDGILIVTPDRKHIYIDGGYIRSRQPTGKNASDFVDWKFVKDYGKKIIQLDALIASHCDADHYGGLWDLLSLSGEAKQELDAREVRAAVLYHAGVSWWQKPGGGRWLGPLQTLGDERFLTQLLGDRPSVQQALSSAAGPKLQGEWAKFMRAALEHGCGIQRLSHVDQWVPGFEPDPSGSKASLKVLAPVEYGDGSGRALVRAYTSSNSQNTNGHSLLLRLDYGNARILLTGDLNKRSMSAILEDVDSSELACDVAKGCHHGSDDISYRFLQAMGAAATVISSGDNEGHAHPRPSVVAASAQTGYVQIHNDEMKTPLVYSTEISRSIDLGKLRSIVDESYPHAGSKIRVELKPSDLASLHYEVVQAGDLNPKKVTRSFRSNTRVVDGVTYGLVNVRTDGKTVQCATLNEKQDKWEVESFQARF